MTYKNLYVSRGIERNRKVVINTCCFRGTNSGYFVCGKLLQSLEHVILLCKL